MCVIVYGVSRLAPAVTDHVCIAWPMADGGARSAVHAACAMRRVSRTARSEAMFVDRFAVAQYFGHK